MKTLQFEFLEFIPDILEDGILYISLQYTTAVHKCVCGCGNEVVTPISPTDWKITFDGVSVSLYPSIGNWNFKCRSHYWIVNNKIEHSSPWNSKQIEQGRAKDRESKKKFFAKKPAESRWYSKFLKSIF